MTRWKQNEKKLSTALDHFGFGVDGPIYGDITDLLSMAFVGKPGTGKSSALLYYLAMLLLVDADVYVFDHQGSLSDLARMQAKL